MFPLIGAMVRRVPVVGDIFSSGGKKGDGKRGGYDWDPQDDDEDQRRGSGEYYDRRQERFNDNDDGYGGGGGDWRR
jgi:hypothetical protein